LERSVKASYWWTCLAIAALMLAHLALPGTASAHSSRVEQWRYIVEQYDWPVESALRVIECESGGDPHVWNRAGSSANGLWQLLGWEWKAYRMFGVWSVQDPEVATAVAYEIYKASGRRFGTSMGWASSSSCHGAY
jgi:hypothetical protein